MTEFIITFLIALIVGLGVGGGGFFVIYLTLCRNYPQLIAQGTNLLFFLACSLSSLFIHLKKRRIQLNILVPVVGLSIVGTLVGSYLVSLVSPEIPKVILGIILSVSGAISLIRIIRAEKKKK